MNARVLQCRYSDGGSAVGLRFSLSYCSGNPYTSLDVKDLVIEEKGNEDFQELLASESFATIVPRDFLTHVYLVVDISNSIQQSNVLDDVASGIKTLFTDLKKAGGNFRVSVFLFDGRSMLYEFIPDTSDLAAASGELGTLKDQQGDDESSSKHVRRGTRRHSQARPRARASIARQRLRSLDRPRLIVVSDGGTIVRACARSRRAGRRGEYCRKCDHRVLGGGNYPKLTQIGRDGSLSAPKLRLDRCSARTGPAASRIIVAASTWFDIVLRNARTRSSRGSACVD